MLTLAGCSLGPLEPDVGLPVSGRCANQDNDPDTDVSFAQDVLPIFKVQAGPVGCACHQPTDPNPIGLQQTGLNLSTYDGVRAGGQNSGAQIIIPASPC